MSTQGSKTKVFYKTALILSAAGFALYTSAHMLARDGSDYFAGGHPLPLLANALCIASVLWFFCACILIPKNTLPTEDFMRDKPCGAAMAPTIGTLLAGAVGFTYLQPTELIAILQRHRAIDANTLCSLLVLLGTLPAAAYFALRIFNATKINNLIVILGAGPIAILTGLCGLTYFELDHHMNAPDKVGLQLAWITTMLFLTAELRFSLGKAQPRRYLASACIALFANACAFSCAFPILFRTTDNLHGTRILAFCALCLGCCIYIGYRLSAFVTFCNQDQTPDIPAPVEEETILSSDPEQTQGKDDQEDGCQQQDPMAS